MAIEWTQELRDKWRETWKQEHMEAGLKFLCESTKPPLGKPETGHDLLTTYALAHSQYMGVELVLKRIDEMGIERKPRMPLDESKAFTPPKST